MKTVRWLFIMFLFPWTLQAQSLSQFFSESDAFFKAWVKDGRVDYAGVKQHFQQIESLYGQLNRIDLTKASADGKKAFYLNAYNLAVVYQVSKYYPLKSPMDQSGFFDKVRHQVVGESLTLNALEINKIVKGYGDARIHFALACAAKSCPSLASFAYRPETLDQQLDERTWKALNDADFIRVDTRRKTVAVSKIFDWYQKDFTKNGQTVLQFINQYRHSKIGDDFKIEYYEYDWQLNSQQSS